MTWEWVVIISVSAVCLTAIWMQAAHHTFALQWTRVNGDDD